MSKTYYSLTVDLPEAESELAQSLLHDADATGLEVRDSEAPPMPGVRGPKAGEAILVGYFDSKADAERGQSLVAENHPQARMVLEEKVDQDWSNEWKKLIRSVTVGRLWVGPPWETPPSDKVCVVVEPKMAFGTGDHPTTSLCLEAVDDFLAEHPGASVLDVGTGTGVLAFAAKKLGASRTVGIDNDAMSVQLAQECALENGIGEVDLSMKTLEQLSGPFDLVLANILANTLVELAPALARHVQRRLVLAGVLAPQENEVSSAYEKQGLKKLPTKQQGEWVRLMFEKV